MIILVGDNEFIFLVYHYWQCLEVAGSESCSLGATFDQVLSHFFQISVAPKTENNHLAQPAHQPSSSPKEKSKLEQQVF